MAITTIIRRLAGIAIIAAVAAVAVPASHAADPALSNTYEVTAVKLNKKRGTARISVRVPLAGIAAIGKNDEHVASQARGAGPGVLTLKLKPHGSFFKHLKKTGKARMKFNISFTPDNGMTNTESHRLTLKYKKQK